jgi:hypothetical protein
MARPDLSKVPAWYHRYIDKVAENDLAEAFTNHTSAFIDFMKNIPVDKRLYRYAEGKWSVQEVFQHVIDGERVFSYRAMCFARKESVPLPSFDENSYAAHSKADSRNWNEMLEEFSALRRSTEILFKSFDQDQLDTVGTASGNPVSVLGIGFIIVGHVAHHLSIIRERYLEAVEA